ncbi:MAG TPA: hypothetical protein VFX80_00145 [Solirubrobacteraceae bacterium]|nr:hypothetical protein [Solirubrobacteraceae bacterium]
MSTLVEPAPSAARARILGGTGVRRFFLVVPPLALAAVLLFHPPGGDPVYEGVRGDVDAWLFVHIGMLLALPLLGIAAYLLLDGLHGLAALVSRVALVFFLVFYTAYEATVGVATGVLVDHANGLAGAEQAAVGDAIQELNRNAVLGDPISVALALGSLGWIVAMVAAAVALRRAGAGWRITVLVGLAAAFAVHPPPIGPIALVCFVAAAVLLERSRARATGAQGAS